MLRGCILDKKVAWNCVFSTSVFLFRSIFFLTSKKKKSSNFSARILNLPF